MGDWVTYKNGNYTVIFNSKNGTKIRKNNLDNLTPEFAENIDVQLTNKCSQGCKFCYANCTANGEHSDILNQKWIHTLHPYTELALNGNDMDHPQLVEFLEFLKEKKVFTNITVNQNQFINNFELISELSEKGLIKGIGVSLIKVDSEIMHFAKKLDNVVLHTIAGITTTNDYFQLAKQGFKVLILGYKDIGRGDNYLSNHSKEIHDNIQALKDKLWNIVDEKWFEVISFDNLAIEQLDVKKALKFSDKKWSEFYMGDEGFATYFINAVDETFSVSSLESEDRKLPIMDSVDEMFRKIQEIR